MSKWKDVEGYAGIYKISNEGNVKRLKRIVDRKDGFKQQLNEMILKKQLTHKGYESLTLIKDKKRKNKSVHRMVAKAFVENKENKSQVNHKDGIKTNNNYKNLEWCTASENIRHAHKNGLMNPRNAKGVNNTQAILNPKKVKEIRKKYSTKEYTQNKLAKEYDVKRTTINNVVNHYCWKEV